MCFESPYWVTGDGSKTGKLELRDKGSGGAGAGYKKREFLTPLHPSLSTVKCWP